MAISIFKAKVLKVIDVVARTNESVVITRRGKALVELIPFHSDRNKPVHGKLSSTLVSAKDVISPLGEELWEACR